ncbi:MAG: 50S ribosomal protein L22 [Acidobacteriota bacterium]
MIVKAVAKYVDSSPQKARLVADMIRGRSVGDALAILRFTKKRAARHLQKLLKAAVANAESLPNLQVDVDNLVVSTIFVDGASLKFRKRTLPAPMGRAYRFVKRQSHITIGLDEKK